MVCLVSGATDTKNIILWTVTASTPTTSTITSTAASTTTTTSTATATSSAATSTTTTDANAVHREPPTKATALASSNKLVHGKKRKLPNTTEDNQLFNNWLSSEIEKNSVKIAMMKAEIEKNIAKKELINLLKFKTSLEIQTLSNPASVIDVFNSEN